MQLPKCNLEPDFNITRASHVVLNVQDLDKSQMFYQEVIGLIPTYRDHDAVYLRGVEEACHHSLVLRRARATDVTCKRIGLRTLTEDDLNAAYVYFQEKGCAAAWSQVAHQGRTLHVTDPFGFLIELCAHMPIEPRQITNFAAHKGGSALRLDHFQMLTPMVPSTLEFYSQLGFRLSEYMVNAEDRLRAVFLQRKGNPHDVVFMHGAGPRLHHFAYMVPEVHHLLRACDVAGELGFGSSVERGPGRHGPGRALFVYFRDPDGHRVEIFNTHYQTIDSEDEPVEWRAGDASATNPWGLPAQRSWFEEASPFEGTPVEEPDVKGVPLTLERFLSEKEAARRL